VSEHCLALELKGRAGLNLAGESSRYLGSPFAGAAGAAVAERGGGRLTAAAWLRHPVRNGPWELGSVLTLSLNTNFWLELSPYFVWRSI
jgi:hypothetical protein